MTVCDFIVDQDYPAGTRLDRCLVDYLTGYSRSRLQTLITDGQVQVNGQVCCSKKHPVVAGDRIIIAIPEPTPLDLQPEAIPLEILYEDDQLLIINKPVGMVVHPAPGHDQGTLVHALLAHCQEPQPTGKSKTSLSGIGGIQRPGIVHRLDRDTSGAIMVAKTDLAHQHLQAQIAAKTAQREYLGLVYGNPKLDQGTIDLPVGRHRVHREKQTILPIDQGGRPAITHWQYQERLGPYSLLHFRLETGRTHQIRVHCAAMGWPIVGDPLYSRGHRVENYRSGQALHAWRLTLTHPISSKVIQVEAPLPKDLTILLTRLRQKSER
jgi:23S rRNA pseudouridine1911/1915/1917 synthase